MDEKLRGPHLLLKKHGKLPEKRKQVPSNIADFLNRVFEDKSKKKSERLDYRKEGRTSPISTKKP